MFGFSGELPPARGLLVGECLGPNTDPRTPMFPSPPNSAAERLMKYGGLTPEEYLGRLERVSQCVFTWDDFEALERQKLIVRWLFQPENQYRGMPLRVLLLGRRVQQSWSIVKTGGFGYERWMGIQVAYAPHPSGLSHTYNDPSARARMRRYLRWTAGLGTE